MFGVGVGGSYFIGEVRVPSFASDLRRDVVRVVAEGVLHLPAAELDAEHGEAVYYSGLCHVIV